MIPTLKNTLFKGAKVKQMTAIVELKMPASGSITALMKKGHSKRVSLEIHEHDFIAILGNGQEISSFLM